MSYGITCSSNSYSFHHAWIPKLSTAQTSIKHLNWTDNVKILRFKLVYIIYSLNVMHTIGFFNSFGLIHLIKNGWQVHSVFISKSKDFLNCVDNVGARFLVSDPIAISSANKTFRNLFEETWINCRRSALNVSRFFSRKPVLLKIN